MGKEGDSLGNNAITHGAIRNTTVTVFFFFFFLSQERLVAGTIKIEELTLEGHLNFFLRDT